MKIIGITGNIGSGKTKISYIFKKYGFEVIELDKVAHKFYNEKNFSKKILKAFGKEIIGPDGKIDRTKLRKIVFANNKNLQKLNNLIHPELKNKLKSIIKKSKTNKNIKGIVIDAALIYELGIQNLCDKIITVYTNRFLSFLRVWFKRKISLSEFLRIYRSQMDVKQKIRMSDYFINNNLCWCLNKKNIERKIKEIIEE